MYVHLRHRDGTEETIVSSPTTTFAVLTEKGEQTLARLHGARDARAGRCAHPAPWGRAAGVYLAGYLAAVREV